MPRQKLGKRKPLNFWSSKGASYFSIPPLYRGRHMPILKFDLSRVNKDFGLNDLATEKLQNQFKQLDKPFKHYTFESIPKKGIHGYLRGKYSRGGQKFLSSIFRQRNGTGKFDLKKDGIMGVFFIPEDQMRQILTSQGEVVVRPCYLPELPEKGGAEEATKIAYPSNTMQLVKKSFTPTQNQAGGKVA